MSDRLKSDSGLKIVKLTEEEEGQINELLRKGFELRKKMYREKLYKLVKITDEAWNRRVR